MKKCNACSDDDKTGQSQNILIGIAIGIGLLYFGLKKKSNQNALTNYPRLSINSLMRTNMVFMYLLTSVSTIVGM